MIARKGLVTAAAALLFTWTSSCKKPEPRVEERAKAPSSATSVSPQALPEQPAFEVRADTFADVRLLRYRVLGFDRLTPKQKRLLYYLQEAALSGRDITYDQKYPHNLAIRRTLEAILSTYEGDRTTPAFKALLTYAKRVWFSNGIHHHVSTKKFTPEGVSPEDFAGYVRAVDAARLPLSPGENVERLIQKLTPHVFDPAIGEKGVNKDPERDPVRDSANHFYVNLTKDEVLRFHKKQSEGKDETPPSYGLNSQLVKRENGKLEERVWKVSGMYGAALAECVRWLDKARLVAETDAQRESLERLIEYYRTGDLRAWDAFNVAWVRDTEAKIDLIHGFIETYGDPLDMRATYEALVELEDADATKRIRTLSDHAQWFEDNSPIPTEYKKEKVVGISARVIEAVVGAGDIAPPMPIGVNLPNSSWIRKVHGSKSVTLGNLLAAHEAESRNNGVLDEFAASPKEIDRARKYGGLAQALLVDMHEVIGHASGQLSPPVAAAHKTLEAYDGTLEEARADLVALYYLLDPKLVELKLVPSLEVGRAGYDSFMRGALVVQLARVPLGEKLEEAHMRNRALIAKWVLAQPGSEQVIEQSERDGETFYAVRDYVKLRKLFGALLREIQRIKSEGDLAAARKLVEDYGVQIEPKLHGEVLKRYEGLKLAPYSGFIQPHLKPVLVGEEVMDVTIEYPTDFVAQQLDYAARYSFLPPYN